ncbi:thioesterase family protein [Algiphilus aromaticivorans]|uniref:thioesterase family protein n=1 Tax=Algiphilus aromaticivorans TaxID=382454 RepID=UPI0005C2405F|nr:thioesterase family protein [Algiphilus aromaticivorans]
MPENAILRRDGDRVQPSEHAAGPWREDAQHGGVPAALMAALAEEAMAEETGDWQLLRLSLELPRPVPMEELRYRVRAEGGRSVRRLRLSLLDADERVAAEAVALMHRRGDVQAVPAFGAEPAATEVPPPEACSKRAGFGGMPDRPAFHATGMQILVAGGSDDSPGPATAWLRPAMPLIGDRADSPTMRACAASDFGNGLSWETPFADYAFANSDLTVFMRRPPEGEWVGLEAHTRVEPGGIGQTRSTLFDGRGAFGMAVQNLLVFRR